MKKIFFLTLFIIFLPIENAIAATHPVLMANNKSKECKVYTYCRDCVEPEGWYRAGLAEDKNLCPDSFRYTGILKQHYEISHVLSRYILLSIPFLLFFFFLFQYFRKKNDKYLVFIILLLFFTFFFYLPFLAFFRTPS